MKWEFCRYCDINGKCENQDRGHKCETGYKILFEENEKLKERNGRINIRDINLCRIANGIRDENFALKRLLAKSHDFIARYQVDGAEPTDAENIEFLSELEMLLNPENVTENVANQKVQHCEKRIDE